MSQINFNLDDFASLSFQEFPDKWNPVGLEDLTPDEQVTLFEFLGYLPTPRNRDQVDQDDLLLVRSKGGGLLDQLFGPSIFGDDNDLVLKLGGNEFLVHQSALGFTCGNLIGELNISDKPVTINSGEESREFWPASITFFPAEDEAVSDCCYRVRLALNQERPLSPLQLRQILRKAEPLGTYLKPVPQVGGSGSETLKLAELEKGEYPVVNATSVETKYGLNWIIELSDGRRFWSSGLVKRALSGGFKIDTTSPATLTIVGHRVDSAGRQLVDCGLFNRQPRQQTQPTTASTSNRLGVMKSPSRSAVKRKPEAVSVASSNELDDEMDC